MSTERVTETSTNFLEGWKAGSIKKMYRNSQKTWRSRHKKRELKVFKKNPIDDYQIREVKKKTSVVYDVIINIRQENGEAEGKRMRVVCETKPFHPDLKGKFGVNPASIY